MASGSALACAAAGVSCVSLPRHGMVVVSSKERAGPNSSVRGSRGGSCGSSAELIDAHVSFDSKSATGCATRSTPANDSKLRD